MAAATPPGDPAPSNDSNATPSADSKPAKYTEDALPKEAKAELEQLRRSLKNRTEEAQRHAKKLEHFEGIDPEKYREYEEAQRKAEEDRLRKEGEFDKMLDTERANTRKEKERADQIQRSWDEESIRRELLAEAVGLEATDDATRPLSEGGMSQIERLFLQDFEKVDGKNVHKTLRGEDGRMSVREFLESQKEGPAANLFAAGLKPGSGSEGGSAPRAGAVTISRSDPLKPTKVQDAVKEGREIHFVD